MELEIEPTKAENQEKEMEKELVESKAEVEAEIQEVEVEAEAMDTEKLELVLNFSEVMTLQAQTKELRYFLKREKLEIGETLTAALEATYQFYHTLAKEVSEHLAKDVFTLTYSKFAKTAFNVTYKNFIDVSKEIREFGARLEKQKKEKRMLSAQKKEKSASKKHALAKPKNSKNKNRSGKKSNKQKVQKPPLSNGKLGSTYRSWAMKQLDHRLSENPAYASLKDQGKLREYARMIEKEVYKATGNLPAEYETTIDNMIDILDKLKLFPFVSKELKRKSFNVENLKELFGKNLVEIRKYNQMFRRQTQENSAIKLATRGQKNNQSLSSELLKEPHTEATQEQLPPKARHSKRLFANVGPTETLMEKITNAPQHQVALGSQNAFQKNFTIGLAKEQLLKKSINPNGSQNYQPMNQYSDYTEALLNFNNGNQQGKPSHQGNFNKPVGFNSNISNNRNSKMLDDRIKRELCGGDINASGLAKQDLEVLNADIPLIIGDYKYYRVFSGTLNTFNDQVNKKLERVQLLTCSKAQLVSRFSQIRENLGLNMKLKRKDFEGYVDKVLRSENKSTYSLLPGWLQGNNQIQG